MLLDFRKPNCTILSSTVSYTGKYFGFLGIHYHAGATCYVVGASNKQSGEIVMRHYNHEKNINIEAAKFEAEQYWQTFKEELERKPESGEDAEQSSQLEEWFNRATGGFSLNN
jgi:hypothetical protein